MAYCCFPRCSLFVRHLGRILAKLRICYEGSTTNLSAESFPTKPVAGNSETNTSATSATTNPAVESSLTEPSAMSSAAEPSAEGQSGSPLVHQGSNAEPGDEPMPSADPERHPSREANAEHLLRAQEVGSFVATGGSCPRAKLLTADCGTFHPLSYPIDGKIAWYNTISGMFCFSQYDHWFIASDYREGSPIFAQNPNWDNAQHPLETTSPWYFLSAKPDETFKLEKKEMKSFFIVEKDPSIRPVFFDKKSGSTKNMMEFEYSDDECSSGSEKHFQQEAYIKTKYQYARAKRTKALHRLRRKRAKAKAEKATTCMDDA